MGDEGAPVFVGLLIAAAIVGVIVFAAIIVAMIFLMPAA